MKKLLIGLLALAPSTLMAIPIVSMPSDSIGPFRHNVFHSAETAGGAGGEILAWFDLNTSESSSWDPESGALSLSINIFSDEAMTDQVGSAFAFSSDLMGNNFNGFDGGTIGSITFQFDALALGFLGLSGDMTMSFLDQDYASNSTGDIANSWQNGMVTLWGSDAVPSLGVDMMMEMSEPGILLLMGLGLIGLGATARRR